MQLSVACPQIGAAFTVEWKTECEAPKIGIAGYPKKSVELVWWGDIDIRGDIKVEQLGGDLTGVPEWHVHGVCKMGRFDRRNCTSLEKLVSDCHVSRLHLSRHFDGCEDSAGAQS
eukprot:3941976-Rhodomonas_salina.9